ncbi:MFS transporter [Streptomyces sp. NPDC047928]|uniref:MFS transporter n=1 Tax=unclassified Streptomyces TaxID=2593676 RepID=UPI003714DBD1
MSNVRTDAPVRAGAERNPWSLFAVLATVQFMIVLDGGIVNIALPSIREDLGFTPTGLAWVMDAYMLSLGGFLLLGGRAADLVGRRRLVLWGLVLFSLASLACGLATEAWHLVVARAAQGLGGALVSPAALALVTDIFKEGPQRHRALGIWGSLGGFAGAVGILVGGLLLAGSWQWVFLINVPIGAAALVVGARVLPESRPHGTGGLDVTGALAVTGGLCLLIYAVVRGGVQGWTAAPTLAEFAVAALLLGAFVARQLRAAAPLIPRVLFRRANVVLGNAVNTLLGALLFGLFFIIALFLQQVRDYSPLLAAGATVPISIAMFTGSQLAFRTFARVPPVTVLWSSLVLQLAALVWWGAVLDPRGGIVATFLLPAGVWCFGLGAAIVAAFVVCTDGLTGPTAGAGSGLVTTTLQIGGAVGVAVLTAVAESRTRGLETAAAADALTSGYAYGIGAAALMAAAGAVLALWLSRAPRPARLP